MATVGNIASMGYSSASTASIKKEITDTRATYTDKLNNKSLTSEERSAIITEYKESIADLNSQLSTAEEEAVSGIGGSAASYFGNSDTLSLFDSLGSTSDSGMGLFFGAKGAMASMSAVNRARAGIENRARSLTSEIKMDRARGINTAGKEEALTNLTENLSIMDDNLNNTINKTLKKETSSNEEYKPVIEKIKDQLEANQKKLDEASKAKETASTSNTSSTSTTTSTTTA